MKKLKKYNVFVKLDAYYENVEGESEEEVINKAIEWFQECEPYVEVEEIEEDEDE